MLFFIISLGLNTRLRQNDVGLVFDRLWCFYFFFFNDNTCTRLSSTPSSIRLCRLSSLREFVQSVRFSFRFRVANSLLECRFLFFSSKVFVYCVVAMLATIAMHKEIVSSIGKTSVVEFTHPDLWSLGLEVRTHKVNQLNSECVGQICTKFTLYMCSEYRKHSYAM